MLDWPLRQIINEQRITTMKRWYNESIPFCDKSSNNFARESPVKFNRRPMRTAKIPFIYRTCASIRHTNNGFCTLCESMYTSLLQDRILLITCQCIHSSFYSRSLIKIFNLQAQIFTRSFSFTTRARWDCAAIHFPALKHTLKLN